jgi:hypothetical protein
MNGGTVNTKWLIAGLVLLVSSLATGDTLACGDKFLVPSRGLRFELTPASRQRAAVLVYVNPASSLPGLFARLSVDPALRKAGYRPTVVESADELERTLRHDAWDVVLLDLADGPLRDLTRDARPPAILAVAVNSTSSDVDRAKKQYYLVLKSPTRSQTFVDALDVAIATRNGAGSKAGKKSS